MSALFLFCRSREGTSSQLVGLKPITARLISLLNKINKWCSSNFALHLVSSIFKQHNLCSRYSIILSSSLPLRQLHLACMISISKRQQIKYTRPTNNTYVRTLMEARTDRLICTYERVVHTDGTVNDIHAYIFLEIYIYIHAYWQQQKLRVKTFLAKQRLMSCSILYSYSIHCCVQHVCVQIHA